MKAIVQGAIHVGVIGIVVAGLLLAITYESDYDRSLRILRAAGAEFKNSGDPKCIVAASFDGFEIDEAVAKELLVHPDIFGLTFRDCRFQPGAFRLMAGLRKVKFMNVTRCSLDSMSEFETFLASARLETFRCEAVPMRDGQLKSLVNPSLQTVSLRQCDGLSKDAVMSLARTPDLKYLAYSGVPITTSEYRELSEKRPNLLIAVAPKDIAELKPYSDAGVELEMDRQANVTALNMDSTAATLPISTLRQFHDLTSLTIVGREISGELSAWLGELTKLRYLNLQGSRVDADALVMLSQATELIYLNLDGVTTTQGRPLKLPSIPNLLHLQACSAAITETQLETLGLKSLMFLSLGSNATPAMFERLAGLDRLNSLALSGITIDQTIGEALGELKSLAHLFVVDGVIDENATSGLAHANKLASLHFIGTYISTEILLDIKRSAPRLYIEERPMIIENDFAI